MIDYTTYEGRVPVAVIGEHSFLFPQFQENKGKLTLISSNYLKRIINTDSDIGNEIPDMKLRLRLCSLVNQNQLRVYQNRELIFDGETGEAIINSETNPEEYEFLVTEFNQIQENLNQILDTTVSIEESVQVRFELIMRHRASLLKCLETWRLHMRQITQGEKERRVREIQNLNSLENSFASDDNGVTDQAVERIHDLEVLLGSLRSVA